MRSDARHGSGRRVPRLALICAEHGMQARIVRETGIDKGVVSRLVNGKMEPYEGWGRKIAAAVGWKGDWHGLFEYVSGGDGM